MIHQFKNISSTNLKFPPLSHFDHIFLEEHKWVHCLWKVIWQLLEKLQITFSLSRDSIFRIFILQEYLNMNQAVYSSTVMRPKY